MYYPSSQIIPNLITNGEEFIYSATGEGYVGNYFITSDGKFFTGKNPNDKPNFKLSPKNNSPESIDPTLSENIPNSYYILNDSYYYSKGINIFNIGKPPELPSSIFPTPTEKEYEREEIQRYFLKKINEISYIEIDNDQYKKYIKKLNVVNFELYLPFSLPWIISGNHKSAYEVNQSTVNRIELRFNIQGFKSYFKGRFDQLFRYSKNENLYTEGKEFRSFNSGKLYRGYYHIHPEKGAMEGRQHIKEQHSLLIPVSGSNINYKVNKTETQVINKSSGY